MADPGPKEDGSTSGRRWLAGIGIAIPVVSGIVIPILFWVVPNDHPRCDRQAAAVDRVEVEKGMTFRDYLSRQGWSAKGVSQRQLAMKVDIVSARIEIEKYQHVLVKLTAYTRDRSGQILAGSIRDRPMLALELEACDTQQRVLTWTPALRGRATYEVSLSDEKSNVELDRSRLTA